MIKDMISIYNNFEKSVKKLAKEINSPDCKLSHKEKAKTLKKIKEAEELLNSEQFKRFREVFKAVEKARKAALNRKGGEV